MRARSRRLLVVVAVVGLLAQLAACSQKAEVVSGLVTVSGEFGVAPELSFEQPLTVSGPSVEVIRDGDGPRVEQGEPILLDFYAVSGADGSVINETYSSEPRPYLLSAEALGVDIYDALEGRHVGSRILQLVPADAVSGATTVAVYDLLPTRAMGEALPPREGLPQVTLADDGEPTVSLPEGAAPPTDLVVQALIRGTGEQVAAGQVITVQYTGVKWSDGAVFDSTWAPGKVPASFPIGVGSVVPGWDSGLVEQTVGSQVLLVVPPDYAYQGTDHELADETLVFVVDILSAAGQPASVSGDA